MDERKKGHRRPQVYDGKAYEAARLQAKMEKEAAEQAKREAELEKEKQQPKQIFRLITNEKKKAEEESPAALETKNEDPVEAKEEPAEKEKTEKAEATPPKAVVRKQAEVSGKLAGSSKIRKLSPEKSGKKSLEKTPEKSQEKIREKSQIKSQEKPKKDKKVLQQKKAPAPKQIPVKVITNVPPKSTGADREAPATPIVRSRKRELENEAKMRKLWKILEGLIVILVIAIVYEVILGNGTKLTGGQRMAAIQKEEEARKKAEEQADGELLEDEENEPSVFAAASSDLEAQAALMAVQYDYDGAIALLQNTEGYSDNRAYQEQVAEYEKQKLECKAIGAESVTHVFFHTLIHDAKKAFDGDQYEAGYNQFMVTEAEFNSIIQQMYDRGYVMVYLDDFAVSVDDGRGNQKYIGKDLYLPEGKIPFVLSQDDVSYYHYMDGDGFASRLIVDENGDVKNEYIEDDGSISVGDYDMVPLIDRFVEQHPDFAYHGHKGYVALTGYEGILGYRTDEVYKTKEAGRITELQQLFFDQYPGGFDEAAFNKECEGAKKVAEAMKANGWKFASHTWGHQNMNENDGIPYNSFVQDTDRWEQWVEPLIGETDTLIYAFGGDIRGVEEYAGERFNYLKQAGFNYFCGVDSSKHWVQIRDNYVRQGRRNIDGYRMFYNPNLLEDLFDVSQAWDPLRPASVPQL